MSICAWVIISVTFQQVNDTPDAKTSTKGNDEGLKDRDCLGEKCHTVCAGIVYQV